MTDYGMGSNKQDVFLIFNFLIIFVRLIVAQYLKFDLVSEIQCI